MAKRIAWNKGKKLHYNVWNKGKFGIYNNEYKNKLRLAKLGKKLSQKHKNNISKKLKGKKNNLGWVPTITWRLKQSIMRRGDKCHFWRGGISLINHKIRNSFEYKLWRESVFKRDDFTCIWCGQRGGKLNADHIKSFAYFPELRFAIDNGRTLCIDCHKKTNTFGFKNCKYN